VRLPGSRPSSCGDKSLGIDWKLYELGVRFYKGRPKDGSMRLRWPLHRRCAVWFDRRIPLRGEVPRRALSARASRAVPPTCRRSLPNCSRVTLASIRRADARAVESTGGTALGRETNGTSARRLRLRQFGASHYRRSAYGERYFRPAADGWYPARAHRSARPVQIDASGLYLGLPLPAWPAAVPGESFVPPVGRGVANFVSDRHTGRCSICRRAFPRPPVRTVVAHKADGSRCPGSPSAQD
jgi:hypothetical protein